MDPQPVGRPVSRAGRRLRGHVPSPGRYDPYVFKDGVTVYVADPNRMPADGHCTDEQLEFYLRLTDADLKPYTGRYARIASTTREQYRAAAGTERVGDSDRDRRIEWLDVVRRLYRPGMGIG